MKNLDRFEVWLNLFEGSDFFVNVFLTPWLDVVLVLTAKPEAKCHSKIKIKLTRYGKGVGNGSRAPFLGHLLKHYVSRSPETVILIKLVC